MYFAALVDSHSWSTVKVDRNGLQFFWQHVLKLDWQWLGIIKPPQVRTLPDILTVAEIEKILAAMRHLGFGILRRSSSSIHGVVRYRVFLLATYSMGLRLSEAMALQVGDIDGERKMVHIRRGKSHKDRMVPLPDLTYEALRALWRKHRHPYLLFSNAIGSPERIRAAISHMDKGGVQSAMKAVVAECGIKKKYPYTRFASPRLCYAPARTRSEPSPYSKLARPFQSPHYRALHATYADR